MVSAAIGIVAGDYVRWGGLFLFTIFIFGFFINISRRFLREMRFWLLAVLLLGMHTAAFITLLARIDQWKLLWFNGMIFELPPFLLLRDLVLRNVGGE